MITELRVWCGGNIIQLATDYKESFENFKNTKIIDVKRHF